MWGHVLDRDRAGPESARRDLPAAESGPGSVPGLPTAGLRRLLRCAQSAASPVPRSNHARMRACAAWPSTVRWTNSLVSGEYA